MQPGDTMISEQGIDTEWASFVDLLPGRAAEDPDAELFAFLPDGEEQAAITLTRGELHRRACAIAVRLQGLEIEPASARVLLLYPSGLEFIAAFFGCLYAGVVAVPAYVPRANRPMTRLRSIVADAQPAAVLTCVSESQDVPRWEAGIPELRGVHRVVTDVDDRNLDQLAGRWRHPGATGATLAFLQYTSGSTAVPKGVMITHRNLLYNSALIQQCFGANPQSRGVFWLPLFHDMGLIGGALQTVYCGGFSTLFSPVSFVQRPIRWLQAISRTRAIISGAPNFAYELCVEKTTAEQRALLDLSSWRVAFNGAEPIRAETLDRFAAAFAPAGFRREAFLPCYGLAEATLLVSGGPRGGLPVVLPVDTEALGRGEVVKSRRPGEGKRLAGSGKVAPGQRVAVVDPETGMMCPGNRVGEIWVSGPSVARGYWGQAAGTGENRPEQLDDEGPFLRTGDLGFMKDDVLFITGRLKDMIILRGRNVYPQDIEWTAARSHPALRVGGAAAFAVEVDAEERLAVVAEIERNTSSEVVAEVIAAIRHGIAEEHDVDVDVIRLIKMLSLPKTSSGKVQRHACRQGFLAGTLEVVAAWTRQDAAAPARAAPQAEPLIERSGVNSGAPSRDSIAAWLAAKVAGPLGIRASEVDTRRPIAGFGIGSLQAVRLAGELEDWLGRKLGATLLYDYPTIESLAQFLAGEPVHRHSQQASVCGRSSFREPIAIVGIGCRFPGAQDPEAFWKLLRDGVDGVRPFPAARWDAETLKDLDTPRCGGFLEHVDEFDADFFGISPREAVFVDPQHRLVLELAWEALEDGGQVPGRWAGEPVGVFIGIATNDYAQLQAQGGGASDGYRITGCAASIAANRVSHSFDFRGPSLAIDTACSSSLVAVHLACRSLWDGESELALAGGVNLILLPEVLASFAKAGFLSADGRCKTFDAQANGYVRGEGAGMVVLKPLARAWVDGDRIYAVIRGGAINQDGRTSGLTAPNRLAQEAVLRSAYAQAGISPGQVDFVEAHGTGTLLGDPIELGALGSVLAEGRAPERKCSVGSVKTNIGHLEAAAGIAGLIKTALALHHRTIPPSLHFSEPNPHVPFDALPLRVQCSLEALPASGRPAIAGVSSFGFGGTNAHLVLEEAPGRSQVGRVDDHDPGAEEVVFPLSARTPAALWDLAASMREMLSGGACDLDLRDLAYTLGARRGHHDYRLALVAASRDEIIDALGAFRCGEPHISSVQGRRLPGRRPRLVVVFSGAGGLWPGAGAALFRCEPAFRAAIEWCDSVLFRQLGWSLASELVRHEISSRIDDPTVARLVQFALQVGLAALWKSWGIVPDRFVGDGIGELAAAHLSGAMSLEDADGIAAGPLPERAPFPARLARLADDRFDVFLEVGPHPILASTMKECLGSGAGSPQILASLRRGDSGRETLRSSAAVLYANGFDLEWSRVSPPGRFVRLPGYPWQRERFWLDERVRPVRDGANPMVNRNGAGPGQAPHPNGLTNGRVSGQSDGAESAVGNPGSPDAGRPGFLGNAHGTSLTETDRGKLSVLPADARHALLVAYLRDRVAALLELAPDRVDLDRPLLSMGLDSLTAMDLKVEVDAALGAALPLSLLLEGSGIRDLAERVSGHLADSPMRPSEAPDPPGSEEPDGRLAHEQQLLWYAHQFTPNPAAYHISGAATIRAELDACAFRRAFRRVIARQDALRTTFAVVNEKPTIRLLTPSELIQREDEWLLIEDATGRGEGEIEQQLAELARRPFDLERGPLLRLHLLSRAATEHIVLLVIHHIISDFWSTAVLVDELGQAYADERAGRDGDAPLPRSRYADFVRWQHAMVAGEEGERHWAYWRQQLSGPLPVLDLPTDHDRPPFRSFQGSTRYYHLDPALTRAIVELGESRGTSLYTTLLAAFQVLLSRYSGQDDVVVGSPVSGRTRPGLEGLIGYFVNLIPMRADLSDNPPFNEFLGRVRRTVADGLEHQDFPFSLMVSRLQGTPDPTRPPLFQVMFAHQKSQRLDEQGLAPFALGVAGAMLSLHGLRAESIDFDKPSALFDLSLMTALDGNRLCVAFEYSTDLHASASIDRLAECFRNLLAAIVADPGRRIADLALVPEEQRHRLLGEWATAPPIPHADVAIHHRFERQVECSPDAVALSFGEESFTYRDVNRLANRVAHRLVELGAKPEAVVGLFVDRWPLRVIGLLGVLKAGGAYLPLDPDHPAERIAGMLKDSRATVLVTDEHLRGRLPGFHGNLFALDALAESIAGDDLGNLRLRTGGDNLAYVVFTSGSTGRPKGVMVSHRSLLAAASAWEHSYSLRRPPLRHLQAAGFAFDVFTGDWVRALTTGGRLVGCPRAVLLDPAALVDLIRRERIECIELVPALADALATHLERQGEDLGGIRLLAVGSDSLRRPLYRRLCRLVGPGGRVVNSYGLTEATIDSTHFAGAQQVLEGDAPVPIGGPFPGTRTYVLDGRGEPVPAGVVGELFIGGPGVARGYVNNPGQTAERFGPDPHGEPGSRVYATGDRARWRAGGVLELLGRRDGQVKVRGFRVEVAEVEAVLARHPGVGAAVVTVVEGPALEKRLAAYVAPTSDPGPAISELRRWLKDRLPEPMVPSSYVLLKAMPLSPNGKLDRSALPPPEAVLGEGLENYVPPRTSAEEILTGITAELLGLGRVGVHDNLFEIGVDSILGIQMVSRARQAGLALDPAHVFRHPNIAELAAAAEATAAHARSNETQTPAIFPFGLAPEGVDLEAVKRACADDGDIEDLYPLTPAQAGMLFHTLADPEAGHYVEQFVCRLRGDLDRAILGEAWRRLVARHQALRSAIHLTDFEHRFQVVHRHAEPPLDYHDWRALTPSEQEARLASFLESDRKRGFVPARPVLSRLAILRLRDDLHQLVWSIHHVLIDGWGLSVLLQEMLDIYEAVRSGGDPVLEESRPFRDYVGWLNRQADEHAERFWRQALRGVSTATTLGVERGAPGRPGVSGEAVAERESLLPLELTTALQELGRARRLTLSTLIQGAWAILLSRYSGKSEVVFGVTVSGRPPELAGVESIVGMFINVLPLRVAVTEESNLATWLRALQASVVELRRFEWISLSQIQAWSDVPPGLPLVESILIVQNLPFLGSLQERGQQLGIEAARFSERTHYPLAVTVVPGTELLIRIGFDAARFDGDTIERMMGHLRTVLEAMACDPDRPIIDVPLMTEREQELMLGRWNGSHNERSLGDVEIESLSDEELDSLLDRLSSVAREER
jgi:amino acid adenylation domain-containing protein